MATQVEVAAMPPTSFTEEELDRIFQLDRIVKLSDSVTSGKHPRIKIPPHLAPPRTSTASPRSSIPTDLRFNAPSGITAATTAAVMATAAQLTKDDNSHGIYMKEDWKVPGEDSQQSARAAAVAFLPGLGLAPREHPNTARRQIDRVLPEMPDGIARAEFASQRARIEVLLREQVGQRAKGKPEAPFDFVMDTVLQKARQLEQTFTPPPVAISDNVITNLGGAAIGAGTKAPSGAVADSGDEQTFYSSNFSTPEFGLTSRIPAESDNGHLSMRDSSDYEPELDTLPSPKLPSQPFGAVEQQQPQQPLPAHSQIPNQMPAEIVSSLVHTSNHLLPLQVPLYRGDIHQSGNTSFAPWEERPFSQSCPTDPSGLSGPSGGPQSTDSERGSPNESRYRGKAAAGAPLPPSPFVRTHDLSPIAPQPAHVSSLAVVAQLPLAVDEQQRAFQTAPTQVTLLRKKEAPQSSPDSSAQGGGQAANNKGKKKAGSKRKVDLAATSPRIKIEPRSPSPILAPPAQRHNKRQRQSVRSAQEIAFRYDDEYSPTVQQGYTDSRGPYVSAQPMRDGRGPVVYGPIDGERYTHLRDTVSTHLADLQQHDEQRNYAVYENVRASYKPQHVQPGWRSSGGPLSTKYAASSSQTNLRAARAASHALIEASSGYPLQANRPGYLGGYEASGRRSVRPEVFDHDQPRSPAIPLPSSRLQHPSPPPARIVVDEFNREYFDPVRPDLRQQTEVETLSYEPNIARERPISRQLYAPAQQYGRVGPQMLPAYEEDESVYRRSPPAFVAPRKIVAQADYVTREYVGYPQREYSVRPPQYPIAPRLERGTAVDDAPARDYRVRASTARPPDAVRYEIPAMARYAESVGSVRPPDVAVQPSHGFTAPANASRAPGSRVQGVPPHVAESTYIDSHHGREIIREYSVRPEPHVFTQRAYSVRPALTPSYYTEQPPLAEGQPDHEYVYPDGCGPREVYR